MPYLDYDGVRCAYWPAYRRAFNMLNERRLMSRGGCDVRLLLAATFGGPVRATPEELAYVTWSQRRSVFDCVCVTGMNDFPKECVKE